MSDADDDFVEGGASDAEPQADDEPMEEEEDEADEEEEEEEEAPSPAKGKKGAAAAAAAGGKKGAAAKAPSTTGGKKATPAKRSAADAAGGAAKKVKSITSESAAKEELTRYMRQQNRPYTALVIYENLHHAIKKPTIIKLCDELVADGVLQSKDFKKTRLYMAKQSDDDAPTPADLDALSAKEASLKERIAEQKAKNAKLDGEIRLLHNQPSDEELAKQLAHYSKQIESLTAKLGAIKGNKNPITKADLDKVQVKFNEALKHWRTRKRAATDLVDQMCGDEGDPKQIKERYSLESDEDNGDKLADWAPLVKEVKGVVLNAKAGKK